MKKFILFCLFTFLLMNISYGFVLPAYKNKYVPPSGFLLPSYNDTTANWVRAGLVDLGGISTVDGSRTACTTGQAGKTMPLAPSGITPPAANDDAANINAVITNCPADTIINLASGTFQISQSEYILLNKSVTLRGMGSCTNGSTPYCSTVINVYNGAIENWTINSSSAGSLCGVNSGSTSGCSEATGVILMSPSGVYDWGWSGCFLGAVTTGCGSALAADVSQGATTVQVASTTNFSVGMWVLIDEAPALVSTAVPTGGANLQASPELLNNSGSPSVMRIEVTDPANTYSMANSRVSQELHLISSIGAGPCPGVNCTLTFDDPLTMAYRQSGSHDARVFWPTHQSSSSNPFLQKAGVENLTITKPANSGIQLTFCAYCWIKNVEVARWIGGSATIAYSARSQIDFNYFHNCADCENNGAEYPIGIDSASTESLIQNNIIRLGGKGMVGRAANTAVVAYNYVDDTFYMDSVIGDYWIDMSLNGSHFVGTHHFLFEGNYSNNCDGDETHGNALYHTFFRNQCSGIRTTFVDPSNTKTVNDSTNTAWSTGSVPASPGPLRVAGPMAFNYWYAFVGNVLGLSGVTTSGNGWVYRGAFCGGGVCSGGFQGNKAIWMSGWVGGEFPSTDPNLTATSGAYIFRHGNYDYVTPGIADWAAGYSHTLPNSFYLASAPSFFSAGASCTYPWPWVTPTSSPYVQLNSCAGSGLPAKARWEAGTPFVQP